MCIRDRLFVFIPNPAKKGTNRNILHEMYEGARIILRNRGMSWLMVSEIAVTFFVMPIVAVMPLMTLQYFNGTPYQVSLIEMLFGIGPVSYTHLHRNTFLAVC